MCCLFTSLIFLGPRVANVIWFILDQARWNFAFETVIIPILGIIFLPWTTLVVVLIVPNGISFFEVLLLIIAIISDVLSYAGGGYGNRRRVPGY